MKAVAADRERATKFLEVCSDDRSFRVWYDGALPKVYGFLLVRCAGDREAAEELTQEAFVEAIRHRDRFDGRSDPATWVISIAAHKLADHYRRLARIERRRLSLVSAQTISGGRTGDPASTTETREEMLRALRNLPVAQRAALVYRYLDDLTVAQIADRIGRSEPATESLLSRGRESLRRELGSAFEEEDR